MMLNFIDNMNCKEKVLACISNPLVHLLRISLRRKRNPKYNPRKGKTSITKSYLT